MIDRYTPEIDALYAAATESAQADLKPPASWNSPDAEAFVRTAVNRVVDPPINDTDDLFYNGCDRYVNVIDTK